MPAGCLPSVCNLLPRESTRRRGRRRARRPVLPAPRSRLLNLRFDLRRVINACQGLGRRRLTAVTGLVLEKDAHAARGPGDVAAQLRHRGREPAKLRVGPPAFGAGCDTRGLVCLIGVVRRHVPLLALSSSASPSGPGGPVGSVITTTNGKARDGQPAEEESCGTCC